MEDLVPLITIISLFVILPGMAMWFRDRSRRWKSEQAQTQAVGDSELMRVAERLERRVEALEKILDAEAPNWRNRHHG